MALKAIDAHRGIGMATLAESVLADHAVGPGVCMAFDAALQTMPGRADAAAHGLITLMENHVHVIAAHFIGRLDALLAFFDLHRGQWHTRDLSFSSGLRRCGHQ